jgi:hypothetical protein
VVIGGQYICNWKFCAQCLSRARQAASRERTRTPVVLPPVDFQSEHTNTAHY